MKDFFRGVLIVPFFLIINTRSSTAQDSPQDFTHRLSIGIMGHYGFIDPSISTLAYVMYSHPELLELSVSTQTIGGQSWQQNNNFPEVGLAFLYGNSGSPKYLGHMTALIPFIKFYAFRSSRFYMGFRVGMGGAWVEKIFNKETNSKNLIIGSNMNFCANLMVSVGTKILPRSYLDAGFSLTHLSNGSMKLPNYGLNPISISAGIKYDLHPPLKMIKSPLPLLNKKWNYYIYAFAAFKESPPIESPVYLVNIINAEVMKDFSYTDRIGAGINFTYDRSLVTQDLNSPGYHFDNSKLRLEVGLYLAYEYVAGNLSFPLQVGVYVYNNYLESTVYETVGIKYRIAEHWVIGGAVKAYLGKGDFIQWGIGY